MPRTHTDPTVPTDQEAVLAQRASHALGDKPLRLQVSEAGAEVTTLEVPPAAVRLIRTLLKEMGDGRALTLIAEEAEITTTQAAEILRVSRPFVIGLIDKGVLPARLIGTHRRVLLKDVLAYKVETKAKRRETLRELAAYDQELGLE